MNVHILLGDVHAKEFDRDHDQVMVLLVGAVPGAAAGPRETTGTSPQKREGAEAVASGQDKDQNQEQHWEQNY